MPTDHEHLAALRAALEKMTSRPWKGTPSARMMAIPESNIVDDKAGMLALVNAADWLLRWAEVGITADAISRRVREERHHLVNIAETVIDLLRQGEDSVAYDLLLQDQRERAHAAAREAQRGTQEEKA